MTPFFLGNIILKEKEGGVRESIPRQVDKSWVPKEEREVWGSQGGDRGLEFLKKKRREDLKDGRKKQWEKRAKESPS